MIRKAFKYRIYPTKKQEHDIENTIGGCRFIYNYGLERKIKEYEQNGKSISCFDLINEVVQLKKTEEYTWLKEVYSQSLQMSLRNLDNAFTKFFKKTAKFPKFKSRKNTNQSYQYPQGIKMDFENKQVYVPKLGYVCLKMRKNTHIFDGKIKTTTLRKTSSGKYFISILVELDRELPIKKEIKEETTLGIDLGIKTFATLSDARKIENPKYLKNALRKLKKLQRQLSKKKKGSANRVRMRIKVAKFHEHVSNQRKNFLHQISHQLTNESQVETIAMEDLDVKGMLQTKYLAKLISDCGWGMFDQFISYKCDWYGKNHIHINRFDASSKICSQCGYINKELKLKDREWICSDCGIHHDRDYNASLNIKKFALHPQNMIGLT